MAIYCPQCGTEAEGTQQFCRKCGVNLSLIGKALSLSESIARGDRGPLPRVKEIVANLEIDRVTDEIGRGLDQMTSEIERSIKTARQRRERGERGSRKPEQRYEDAVRGGMSSFFGGIGFMIVFYLLAPTIILKIPPERAARIPFELEPVIRMLWIVGLLPVLTGIGRTLGALMTKPSPPRFPPAAQQLPSTPPAAVATGPLAELAAPPPSVTEHTTELLESDGPVRMSRGQTQ